MLNAFSASKRARTSYLRGKRQEIIGYFQLNKGHHTQDALNESLQIAKNPQYRESETHYFGGLGKIAKDSDKYSQLLREKTILEDSFEDNAKSICGTECGTVIVVTEWSTPM